MLSLYQSKLQSHPFLVNAFSSASIAAFGSKFSNLINLTTQVILSHNQSPNNRERMKKAFSLVTISLGRSELRPLVSV